MPTQQISRREFLKVAGITLGASALAGSGMGCVASNPAQPAPQIETPEFAYGKEGATSKRILVTYATRTGSTVGVAAAIGETLGRRGFAVDVKPIKENPALDGYQAVLIGSAINGAQWLPEAVEFVQSNQPALQQAPVALFSVHIMNLGDDEKSKRKRLAYLNGVRPLLKAADEAFFAGIGMNAEEQGKLVRWAYRTFKIGPEGDCRDWGKIRGWAEAVGV